MRIAVVDDDQSDRFLTTELIRDLGFEAEAFSSGPEALQSFETRPSDYAMILMDLRMPELDGVSTVRRLRKNLTTRDIPVIVLTSDFDWLMSERQTAAGFSGACLKPIDLSQLTQAIMRHALVRG